MNKFFIVFVSVTVFFSAVCNAEENLYTDGPEVFEPITEVETIVQIRASAYKHSKSSQDDVIADMRADMRVESQVAPTTVVVGQLRVIGDTADIAQDTTLDSHDGHKTIMSIREAYVEFTPETSLKELNIAIGKKIVSNAVQFDFAEFNPLARRDQSEPFSVMDNGTRDGVLLASVEMQLSADASLFGQCVVAGRNNPITATESNDHWSRDLPLGMSQGDPEVATDINYLCRMWQERDDGSVIEVAVFHGSGSGVDHVVSNGVDINPVFVEETGISASASFTLGDFVTRLGCDAHFQNGSDDFVTCLGEVDRIFEFENGATLFVEMGYVNSFVTNESDVSMSGLDMRRALNNHLVASVEYSPVDGLTFSASGAKSLEAEDYYFRIQAEVLLDTFFPTLEEGVFANTLITVRGECISGEQHQNGEVDTIFGAHDDDDRVMLIFTKEF